MGGPGTGFGRWEVRTWVLRILRETPKDSSDPLKGTFGEAPGGGVGSRPWLLGVPLTRGTRSPPGKGLRHRSPTQSETCCFPVQPEQVELGTIP